jgi:DNA adenine methylase
VGGAALFYNIKPNIQSAVLSDLNLPLVITYQVVQNQLPNLLNVLRVHQLAHCKDYYYKIRSQFNLTDPVEIAARFIYLNKTCFNGLYRVNRKGEFNVPMGTYKNPAIVQEDILGECSRALSNVTILHQSFEVITPTPDDFVYLDPPYDELISTSFTTYTAEQFGKAMQVKLRDFVEVLDSWNVKWMLSNSNTDFVQDLYKNFNVEIIHAPRKVNCNATKRGNVEEVIVRNYTN